MMKYRSLLVFLVVLLFACGTPRATPVPLHWPVTATLTPETAITEQTSTPVSVTSDKVCEKPSEEEYILVQEGEPVQVFDDIPNIPLFVVEGNVYYLEGMGGYEIAPGHLQAYSYFIPSSTLTPYKLQYIVKNCGEGKMWVRGVVIQMPLFGTPEPYPTATPQSA